MASMVFGPLGALLIRVLGTYFFVLLSLRIMGKREIGKLSLFDLVVSIMIAEVSAVSLQDMNLPLWHGLVIVAVLVLLQILVAYVSMRSPRIRTLFEGRPTVLIANGRINDRAMRRTRYNIDDLLLQLREKDIAAVADVEFAILETSGKLSVFPKAHKRPLTPEDLGLKPRKTVLTTSLIVDGRIDDDKLRAVGKSRKWLRQQLVDAGIPSEQAVFYAGWDGEALYLDKTDGGGGGTDRTGDGGAGGDGPAGDGGGVGRGSDGAGAGAARETGSGDGSQDKPLL